MQETSQEGETWGAVSPHGDMGSETEKGWDLSGSGRPTNVRTHAQPLGASAELERRLQDGREAGPSVLLRLALELGVYLPALC